jgi:D-sedoheptulose 7-phosphate isomerase
MSHTRIFLHEAASIIDQLDVDSIDRLCQLFVDVRDRGGRLFILGVGGSAGNAGHAVNDFRKLCGFEAYAPTDNVSELTARTNDEGWQTVFVEWLRGSRLTERDMLFVLSVGGGDLARNISPNLVLALQYAQEIGAAIGGIVGREQGYTAKVADACVVVPAVNPDRVTPHAESFQGLIWHLLVSSPALQCKATRWESAVRRAA